MTLTFLKPKVDQVQLEIAGDWKRYESLVGKEVQAEGTLFHGFNGHHRTQVLLTVQSLR